MSRDQATRLINLIQCSTWTFFLVPLPSSLANLAIDRSESIRFASFEYRRSLGARPGGNVFVKDIWLLLRGSDPFHFLLDTFLPPK